uniref:NADH-ubiquinone oxidoreductase chain 1 n=1 Tax=Rachycentron canadum TaxID=141264 RepID=B5U131_RACCA|nr:NADH dehydrogenase subunit 1 [Rachycentron canadum]ACH78268.1 NADH dehydrogenase subunit 1 [Rachycentron canadum]
MWTNILTHILNPLAIIVPLLIAVAFMTLLERKLLSYMQLRKGPNITGPYGLLQPAADGVKLFLKELIRPTTSASATFFTGPALAMMLSLLLWAPLPMPFSLMHINLSTLYILALSSFAVYPTLCSGWASNSKYALVGSLRAVAQTISYEVSIGLLLLSVIILAGGFSLQALSIAQENIWFILPAWPIAMMWFTSTLAETKRAPFDLTEGESELVSGYNVEYAGGQFALFFLAEYTSILLMNLFTVILFLGGIHILATPELTAMIYGTKTILLALMFLWIRASFPRLRYDQLMHLTWKMFLPISLTFIIWHLSLPIASAGLPPFL